MIKKELRELEWFDKEHHKLEQNTILEFNIDKSIIAKQLDTSSIIPERNFMNTESTATSRPTTIYPESTMRTVDYGQ